MLSLSSDLLDRVDYLRADASQRLPPERKSELGQFLTPLRIARLMASMFKWADREVRILDPGAGVGSLSAACISELCSRPNPPDAISVTAYEVDPVLQKYLSRTIDLCAQQCRGQNIRFEAEIITEDFVEAATVLIDSNLFTTSQYTNFNCAILNPPYRKISSTSKARQLLSHVGLETTNLYPAFVWLTAKLLEEEGELVAITPRSFCNGPYFKEFRKQFLHEISLDRIHIFDSRTGSFKEEAVLQENVILKGIKRKIKAHKITISSSNQTEEGIATWVDVSRNEVVKPGDPESFIHILTDGLARAVSSQFNLLEYKLHDLNLEVSTGRVVDFRSSEFLRAWPEKGSIPLIYPTHFANGGITWPKEGKKPNALVLNEQTKRLLVPNGRYVLVKRFSSKEEKKRVVAVVYEPMEIGDCIGFENHINYFHLNGRGMERDFAWGLCAFLNSSFLDTYFRQFNGHTQVNATDLRSLQYPSKRQLESIGAKIGDYWLKQSEIDGLIEEEIMQKASRSKNPLSAMKKIKQATNILKEIGFPRAQQNERSALTLLALLGLRPGTSWPKATNPLCGITPMMDFFSEYYGKSYAPNTRETVRRQTVHQMLDAGLIEANPDDPSRPVNSPKAVYRVERGALELMQTFGKTEWNTNLAAYLSSRDTLKDRYAQERKMALIPVQVAPHKLIKLSPGGQNILVEKIIHEFAPRFTPGASVLYIGDAGEKFAHFEQEQFEELGLDIDSHGKMPDVVIYYKAKEWLVLVEAVTSHGPVDPKRRAELSRLFSRSKAGLVFVTAFLDRRTLNQYLAQISWETEVWVADSPTHLIHFNGERFLGPY